MTAIEAPETAGGDEPFELHGVLDLARGAAARPADTAGDDAVDPALAIGRRLIALESGNASQREIARLLSRGLELAEAVGRPRDANNPDADEAGSDSADSRNLGVDGPEDGQGRADADPEPPVAYRIALEGVDAAESLASALNGTKARMIADAYAHAREELLDPTLSPGQRIKHTDGDHSSSALSSTQIVGADLSVILNQSPGFAKHNVSEATTLVLHMPHTLARIEAGELTGYQQHQVMREAAYLPPTAAERLDELLAAKPFHGRHVGTGDHRATTGAFTRRLNKAVAEIGYEPPEKKDRKRGHAGRYVRFGLTGSDGMTRLHGSLPAVLALAINTLLDDLARTAPEHDTRSHEQRRADAFATLFTGPAALSPAAQLSLGLEAPSFDEEGQFTVVDDAQNLDAAGIWETIRLLAAGIGLTFPDVPRAVVNVDVTLETLTDTPCAAHDCPRPGRTEDVCPESGAPPGDACPGNRPDSGDTDPDDARGCDSPTRSRENADARADADRCRDAMCCRASAECSAARHQSATVRGVGPIPDALAHRLARFGELRRVLTDPLTGQPLEVGRRHPSRKLRDAVLNRDRHCRFPGCTRAGISLDLDHITPYRDDAPAAGQTSPHTLHALCREHHRVKHQLQWHPTVQRDGTIRWRNNLLDITAVT